MPVDQKVSHHEALVYVMVIVSAADSNMTNKELHMIGDIVQTLPVFNDFDAETLPAMAEHCADRLGHNDGLEEVLEVIGNSLPPELAETAYAMACEIAAADLHVSEEESRILEMIRYQLNLQRLVAAAIERCTKARYTVL